MTNVQATDVVNPIELEDEEVRFYAAEGYLLLPAFLRDEHVSALREETLDVLEANGMSRQRLASASDAADKLRQNRQYLADSRLNQLINGGGALRIASRLIEGPAHMYMPFTAVKAGGGGGQFHMHQDNSFTRHEPAMGSINLWIALDDMTPANGCLRLIPRSHRQGQLDVHQARDQAGAHRTVQYDPDLALPLRMHAGDAVAFTRWTVHGSGPNRTDRPRVAYALQCHREDVTWRDNKTGQWARLVDAPRWTTGPVARLGPDASNTRENTREK